MEQDNDDFLVPEVVVDLNAFSIADDADDAANEGCSSKEGVAGREDAADPGSVVPLGRSPPHPRKDSLSSQGDGPGSASGGRSSRRSRTGNTGGIDRAKALESPRRSGGRRRSKPSEKGGLSQRTLSIVTNLEVHKPKAKSRREVEEQEEEKRLALEEKRQREAQRARDESEAQFTIRILMLGDSGVGKTSLMHRFSEDHFAPNMLSTAGVDFKVQHLDIDGKRVRCQIWDTAGQEKFHVITRAYYRGAHGIALVYDVTDADSYKNVNYWMANLQTHADKAGVGGGGGGGSGGESGKGGGGDSRIDKMVLGNKVDLGEAHREISTQAGQDVAREYGALFYEVSAKDGSGVRDAFYKLACTIVRRLSEGREAANGNAGAAGGGGDARSRKPVQTIFLTKRSTPSFRNRLGGGSGGGNGSGSTAAAAANAEARRAVDEGEAMVGEASVAPASHGGAAAGAGTAATPKGAGFGAGKSLFKTAGGSGSYHGSEKCAVS